MSTPDLLQLAPALHRLRIPGDRAHLLNCYLWVGPDGVTLIDTGWPDSAELIAEALTVLGKHREDVLRIVLTHFHEDHTGSAAEIACWSTLEVVAGAADAPYVRDGAHGPLPKPTELERAIHADFDEPSHGPAWEVNRTVLDGNVLDFAGGARVIAVPGHTPGSIGLYLPEADAVLTGDAVAEFHGQVILGVFNTDREAATGALDKFAGTGAQVAGFGHGDAVLTGAAARIQAAEDVFADP